MIFCFYRSSKPLLWRVLEKNTPMRGRNSRSGKGIFAVCLWFWQFGNRNFNAWRQQLFSSLDFASLISNFAPRYPNIRINLIEENTTQLTELLQKGIVDLILDNTTLDSAVFDSKLYKEEHLVLAVPHSFSINSELTSFQIPNDLIEQKDFQMDSVPVVPLRLFSDLPFIMLRNENDTGRRARLICQDSNFKPNIILNMDQQMTAYNICQSGLGICFIGDIILSRIPQQQKCSLLSAAYAA